MVRKRYWRSSCGGAKDCKSSVERVRAIERIRRKHKKPEKTDAPASRPPSAAVLQSAVTKVNRHVLPLFVTMFIANYIDRVNIGFVNSYMQRDLGIGAEAFGLGSGVFLVGYAIFEVPSNVLMAQFGARAWLTRIMFPWGLVAAAMAFVWNDMSFYVLRFLLGVAEAGFFPGVVYYFTQCLPQKERGKAVAIFLGPLHLRQLCRVLFRVDCFRFVDLGCTVGNGCF
jgi:sugar phosphate permease